MSVDPTTTDLLAVARETLRQAIMPALAGEQRYHAAMIAQAIAVVERSLAAEAGRINVATRRRLVAEIRAGQHDGAAGARLVAQLLKPDVLARLAVSAPDHRWRP